MPKLKDEQYLRWLVKSRSKNQEACLDLYALLGDQRGMWSQRKYSVAAEGLVGIGFSLWRAVFLGNRTGDRPKVVEHATKFLRTMIHDNAISYAHDRDNNEWSFNYYVHNARYRLEDLHDNWTSISPKYVRKNRNAIDRW